MSKLEMDEICKNREASCTKTDLPTGGQDDHAKNKGPLTPKPADISFTAPKGRGN